ncbi:MAG: hypothetical protein ACRDOI_13255 [Trebonia sp.]
MSESSHSGTLARLRACGYSDHAHLDREFKGILGCTPTQLLGELAVG